MEYAANTPQVWDTFLAGQQPLPISGMLREANQGSACDAVSTITS
jgi:hypothetical protein